MQTQAITRCKVRCIRTAQSTYGYGASEKQPLHEAEFAAVTGVSEENKRFFNATPSIQFKTGILAGQFFEIGKEYYLDFIPADDAS